MAKSVAKIRTTNADGSFKKKGTKAHLQRGFDLTLLCLSTIRSRRSMISVYAWRVGGRSSSLKPQKWRDKQ